MSINDKIKYEVALSFAGEQRDYVRKVAEVLKDNNVDCYFDEFDEIELWGKYMPDRFQEVMGDKSKYAVIFISEEYKNKFYTNLERMTLLTSDLFREGRLLPAKFDDTKLPGLPDGINYVTLKDLSPEEFAKKIMRKIGTKTSKDVVENKVADFYIPKTRKSVNPITQRKEWIKYITQELKRRAVKVDGLEMDDDDEGSHHRILFHYNGKTLVSIRIIKNSIGNDGLAFGFDYGYSSTGGMNAWGDFDWSLEKDEEILKVHGMSSLGDGEYTKKDLVDALWKKITKHVDEENT